MSLDIRFKEIRPLLCPHCGQIIKMEAIHCEVSSGRDWYPVLESIGYYVPHNKRTKENDWYGEDMSLTSETAKKVYEYIKNHRVYGGNAVSGLIARALMDGNTVVVNADW